VDLQPGNEIRAIDFTLVRQQRVKLSGHITDGETGRPPQNATVSVASRDAAASASPLDALIGLDPSATRYNAVTGEFVLQNVATGSYWLQVIAQGQTPAAAAGGNAAPANVTDALAALSAINTARIPIEVVGADIDNLNLTVTSGASVPGRVRIEGAPDGSQTGIERVGVSLQSTSGGANIFALLLGGAVRPAADGTFSIARLSAGDYKLIVNGLAPSLYIKNARVNQTDVMQSGLTVSSSFNGTLEITLGINPGQVSGSVVDAALKPVSGVQAVLIPDKLRDRQDLYKTASTDQEGRFTIRGITPGEYRVFAWEDIEPFSYYDAGVLRQYEQQGKLIRIQESSAEVVDVKLIPAATP